MGGRGGGSGRGRRVSEKAIFDAITQKGEANGMPQYLIKGSNYDGMNNWLSSGAEAWESGVTTNEHSAMHDYSYQYDWAVNSIERGYLAEALKQHHMTESELDMARTERTKKYCDSVIGKYELTKDVKVYRGAGGEFFGVKSGNSAEIFSKASGMVGHIVTDKGYTSTSVNGNSAFNKPVFFNITVRAGKGKGAFIAKHSVYQYEREFLLHRNSHFMITAVRNDHGKVVVDMEQL